MYVYFQFCPIPTVIIAPKRTNFLIMRNATASLGLGLFPQTFPSFPLATTILKCKKY